MICEKCKKENPEESLFCNSCGTKLQQEEELVQSNTEEKKNDGQINNEETQQLIVSENVDENEKQNIEKEKTDNTSKNKVSKQKMLSIIIVCFLIIGFCGFGIYKYNAVQQKKAIEAKHQQYVELFQLTFAEIGSETLLNEIMCATISDTWRSAIWDTNEDFNTAIADLHSKWDTNGDLKKREDNKKQIEENMKRLQNSPDDYKDAYKLLVDYYTTYSSIYDQAISPSGSYTSYNSDVSAKESEFNKLLDKIKIIKPDINSDTKSSVQ